MRCEVPQDKEEDTILESIDKITYKQFFHVQIHLLIPQTHQPPYNHIMISIYTTHKLIPDHTQHTKTVNLKNQDKEPQPAMLNIFPDP